MPDEATEKNEMKDVIVLLPGILGSVLEKDGAEVWGLSLGAVTNAVWNFGSNITDLEIPTEQINNPDYNDGVTATRLMPDAHLIPGFWKIDGYGLISQTLHDSFNLQDGENYFEFPYDWRRDIRLAARRLSEESSAWLKNWRNKTQNPDAKLILVGHSMGGLVSRYFLEVLGGWRDTSKLITFATPYAGSLKALNAICNGMKKKIGIFQLIDFTSMLRSFTGVYQLLPTFACWEDGTGKNLHLNETGVIAPNLDMERIQDVFEFRREIDDAIKKNNSEYGSHRYQTLPLVGLHQPTLQSFRVVGAKIEIMQKLGNKDIGGDGTVPSISATPPEWSSAEINRATYIAEQHASLQNNSAALVQIVRVMQSFDFEKFKAFDSNISLEIDDVFAVDESILARAKSKADDDLTAVLRDADTDVIITEKDFDHTHGNWQTIEFEPPHKAGKYRLTISEKKNIALPVTDIFLVL